MLRYLLAPIFLSVALLAATQTAFAAPGGKQSLDAIPDAVQRFLNLQLASYGDRASFTLGKLDNRLSLAPCDKLDIQLPTGNRLLGNTSVRVQCVAGAKWAISMPVAISIQSDYWVAARALPGGYDIAEGDLEKRNGDLAQLPPGAITDPSQALGRTTLGGLAAGLPVRTDLLRAAYTVRANDQVRVVARGEGFEVATEGRAMSNANDGQQVSVKLASGAVVKGLAKSGGVVEIVY